MVIPDIIYLANPTEDRTLDAILGRMIREVLDFEGMAATKQTFKSIESIIEHARRDAQMQGLEVELVNKVAARISIQTNVLP